MSSVPDLKIGYRSKSHSATIVVNNAEVAKAVVLVVILIVVMLVMGYLSIKGII